MKIIPLTRDAAKDYVRENHRHNKPPTSHKFSLGLLGDDGKLVGVLIAGRPVARLLDDGLTLELTRVCTDGTRNACSMLAGAARRAAAAMGYERIYTYTQADEGGASMRAAGFVRDAELEPRGSWADHSVAREGRNEDNGGVARVRWLWRRDGKYNPPDGITVEASPTKKESNRVAIRTLAVCAGYGGLELGIRLAGVPIQLVAVVERQAYAAAVIANHMERHSMDPAPIWDDLESFDGSAWRGRVDLVVGGIPCQGASVAGKRKGVDDERWLWPTFWRVVQQCGASMLFLENVPGLLNVNDGKAFGEILESLAASGWIAEWDCFPAAAVGAPHIRDRVFLLAADPHRVDVRQLAEWKQQRQAERGHAEPVSARAAGHDADDAGGDRLEALERGDVRAGELALGLGGAQAADPEGIGQRQGLDGQPRADERRDAARGGAQAAADADGDRLQGERHGGQLDSGERSQRGHDVDRCDVSPEWSAVVGWPSPEPAFRRVDDGAAHGLDVACTDGTDPTTLDYAWHERVHLLGNGVVPQAAAYAFGTLADRLAT